MKKYFRQWWPYLFFGGFFSMFINILQLTFPVYMLQIYDRVLSSYSMSTLAVITIAAVVSLIVMSTLEFIRSRLLVRCGVAIDQSLSEEVINNVIHLSSLKGPGSQQASIRDVSQLRNFFAGNAIFTLFDIPWTPLFLVVIFYLHTLLGLVATGGAVLLLIFAVLNEFLSRKPLKEAGVVNGQANRFLDSAIRNAPTVNAMGMKAGMSRYWHRLNDNFTHLQTRASRNAGLITSLSGWLRQSMQVFIYGVGAWLTLRGEATPGSMIAASIIMGRALQPVQQSIGTWKQMVEARGAWNRLDELFQQISPDKKMDLPAPEGRLAAEQAGLAYGGKVFLHGVNFTLEPGESLGIIGPSGAGKSTLCRMLLGIIPSSSGKIRLDGNDIFLWEKDRVGPYLGYLSQEIELFNGTIAENIGRFTDLDAEKVIRAAQKAGVHELVLSFPNGYDTRIGDKGQILSGGQKQRISLARAYYGDPKLIVLDEPNSNLDSDGETALLKSFAEMKQTGSTLVVVSHKPAILSTMDKILLLRNGQMAMYGPREAVFQKLIEQQQQQQQQQHA